MSLFFFFFNDTATTEIYTLSLHDALPISPQGRPGTPISSRRHTYRLRLGPSNQQRLRPLDRKSTRLNSSHANISYAVFCLKKKKHKTNTDLSTHDTPQSTSHYNSTNTLHL